MSQIKSIVDKDFSSERLSFIQLVNKYKIVIPVIQRDYAQGRKTDKPTEVRKGFVRNLISYLQSADGEVHDLDFVYGTVVGGEFIPLDGQQRLTTLFLLHLYIASKSGNYGDFVSLLKSEDSYRFAYKTRKSSTMFCERLLTYQVIEPATAEDDDSAEDAKKQTLYDVVTDQGWFFMSWLNDPTVSGMLEMMQEIDTQFSAIENFDLNAFNAAYERLKGDSAPVTFQMLPLNGYNRTDDLYIKLNARGVYLSDFENFKARLEDWMKGVLSNDMLVDFKKKVDGEWNDYLWQFRNESDNTDHIMENLFRNFIAFSYRPTQPQDQSAEQFKRNMNVTMSYLLEQNGKMMRFSFAQYSELGVVRKEGDVDNQRKMIERVISFFDVYCRGIQYKGDWLQTEFIEDGRISPKASYSDRLRLYAYLQYCATHKNVDDTELNQWMRLIRNLDCATDIDTAGDFYEALVSVDDMIIKKGEANKVQDWLATMTSKEADGVKFFRKRQLKEELIKARLLARESVVGANSVIKAIQLGDHDKYFKGQIGFALEFVDAYVLFEKDEISNMPISEIEQLGDRMFEYIQKSSRVVEILPNDNVIHNEKRLVERALLSLGMYLRKNSANRYNLCNLVADPYNSPKTLLFVEGNEGSEGRKIFKNMLDRISCDTIQDDLLTIINNRNIADIPEWRNKLIENSILIDYCKYGFIYINTNLDVRNVILLGASQMNHYHSELWSRDLYERERGNDKIQYREQKRQSENSVIYREFSYANHNYEFRLFYQDGAWEYKVVDIDDDNASIAFNFNILKNDTGETMLAKAVKWFEDNNC